MTVHYQFFFWFPCNFYIFIARIADEKLVLASLEQYILVNSSDILHGTSDNLTVTRLVNLYSLFRGLGSISNQVPYSREAQRILFQLINEGGWDLLSARIQSVSLKWLFQQENIIQSLCHQILNFCRSFGPEGVGIMICGNNNQTVSVQTLAELVSTEDNYGARLFICLLAQLVEEEEDHEHDIISVLDLMTTIVQICPAASDQLFLHGIGTAIRTLCYSSHIFSTTIFMSILVLVFNILSSAHSETTADHCWGSVTMKVSD